MNLPAVVQALLFTTFAFFSVDAAAADPAHASHAQVRQAQGLACTPALVDQGTWVDVSLYELPQGQTFCVRLTLYLPERAHEQLYLLKLSMLAASEIYWDGEFIGTNGTPGDSRATEIPGRVDMVWSVPQALTRAGEHQLLISASNHHLQKPLHSIFYYLAVEDFDSADDHTQRHLLTASFFLGGLLLAFLVFQILFWRYQSRLSYQLLSALCLFSAFLLLVEKWRLAVGYTYDLHLLRLQMVWALTWFTCLLLGGYYWIHYQLDRNFLRTGVFGLVLLASGVLPLSYDAKSALLFLIAFIWALIALVKAAHLRKPGVWWGLPGMAIVTLLFLFSPESFLEDRFALAAIVMVIVALIGVVDEMRLSRIKALSLARMEAELLRKNLQPHFLMNSLTLAIEWIEQAPASASAFVKALAEELGMLVAYSDKKLISLDDEILLCKRHLEIMGFRYLASYTLKVSGSTEGILLPPAVIHTQIENAFSHNRFAKTAEFTLVITQRDGKVCLQLTSPLALNKVPKELSVGFGQRYIESRLEEAFGSRYGFSSRVDGDAWVSVIEFEV